MARSYLLSQIEEADRRIQHLTKRLCAKGACHQELEELYVLRLSKEALLLCAQE